MQLSREEVLTEARRLYDLGWAIHWLHPKSKRPVRNGWTKGERETWEKLEKSYKNGMNLGVRLGNSSKLSGGSYLGVVDCDVKSGSLADQKEMEAKLKCLNLEARLSTGRSVMSGRGNGSKHIYVQSERPLKPKRWAQSDKRVVVEMPSANPSAGDMKHLTPEELRQGKRMRPAWEISIMGEGQQTVLPPSIHPDTGNSYRWASRGEPALFQSGVRDAEDTTTCAPATTGTPYKPLDEDVDLFFHPVKTCPEAIAKLIIAGEGAGDDRSVDLYRASLALLKGGYTEQDVLTVLSDRTNFLGDVAYAHTGSGSRERAWRWLQKYTLRSASNKTVGEYEEVLHSFQEITPAEISEISAGEGGGSLEDEAWKKQLVRGGQNGEGPPKPTVQNTVLVLQNAIGPRLFKRDTFAFRDTYGMDAPWGVKEGKLITDNDLNEVIFWLSQHYRFEPNLTVCNQAIDLIAGKNSYHPVRDYFRGLPDWDGTERLDGWLKNHAGAEGPEWYSGEVFRKWMVAAATRIFEPGRKFDWMLILEGLQGIGKSLFCETLASPDWFLDRLEQLQHKDAAQGLEGIWIVEMGELSDLKRNEIETTKAFITRTVDKYRPPYGRKQIEVARQCVFMGSTNKDQYLKDDQNRRFVPIKVGQVDIHRLKAERDMLWAEAYFIYRNGLEEHLYLDGRVKDLLAEMHAERKVMDDSTAIEELLQDFHTGQMRKPEEERFPFGEFRLSWLFANSTEHQGPTPLSSFKPTGGTLHQAGRALRRLGASKQKAGGRIQWEW